LRLFLGASLLALASAGSATAQTSAVISEVVVTASRSGSTIQQLPVSASIVDSESVSRQLDISTNVMRALEFTVPGLAPQQNGRSNCVKIRGRMTAVQINGIPVNEDLRQSTCDQVYQLSPFAIERVEVLRGGTALYGAGAPGGIINFVTRQAQSEALEIDVVALTSFNTSDASDTFTTNVYLGAGQKFSGWDYYLGAAYTDGGAARTPGGDYVPGREFEAWSFNGAVGVAIAGGELRATGTYYDETKGDEYATDGGQIAGRRLALVTPIAAHPQSSQNRLRSAAIAVGYTHPAVLGQELAVSVFAQDQLYRQRDNFYTAAIGNDFFASDSDNERFGLRSTLVKRATVSGAELVVSYGFDFTRNRYYRPQIDPSRGGRLVGYIAPETILDTSALFLVGCARSGTAARSGRRATIPPWLGSPRPAISASPTWPCSTSAPCSTSRPRCSSTAASAKELSCRSWDARRAGSATPALSRRSRPAPISTRSAHAVRPAG
jgi:iron complex outermembrane recepter protein